MNLELGIRNSEFPAAPPVLIGIGRAENSGCNFGRALRCGDMGGRGLIPNPDFLIPNS